MDLKTFKLLARYNLWATQKLNQTLLLVSDGFVAQRFEMQSAPN
ncbi:hypothetical protein [Acinetobacter sp. YH12120]|nr:hypothetical protein [Acinetobacter sp. YH12120]